MTSVPGTRRLFGGLQILAALAFVLSGMLLISSLGVLSRAEYEAQTGKSLPADWERVFVNHRTPYNWPFGRGATLVAAFVFATSATVLGLTIVLALSKRGMAEDRP